MREGWTYKKLGECFPFIKNGANIKQLKDSDGLPITRIETLSGGVFNRDRMGYASIYDSSKYLDYILEDGDLLMSHINSKTYIGRTVEYKKERAEVIIHGMNLLRLKADRSLILPSFMAYYTNSTLFKSDVARIRKDAVNQSSMAIGDLRKIDIPLPPKSQQEAIVSELDEINSLLALKREQLQKYDKLAQSLFYEMFGDPVENEKGWEVKKLSKITTKIGSGATPKGGNESYKKEGISLIRSMNVHNNKFVYEDLAHIDEVQAKALSNVDVHTNDVLLNITGASVARCCIVPKGILPARVNQHVCIIRSNNSDVMPIYINRLLTNDNYQLSLLSLSKSKAATREALPKSVVDNLQIPLPPLPLQQQFASRIEQIELQKQQVQASIEKLETLLASRMQYWFE